MKDSIKLDDFDAVCKVSVMDDATLINGIDFDEMDNIRGSSHVECYLSQHRGGNDNDVINATKLAILITRELYHCLNKWLIVSQINICLMKYVNL